MTPKLSRIKDFKKDTEIQGFYLVREKHRRTTRTDRPYLQLVLQDGTGSIEAKVWENVPAFEKSFQEGEAAYGTDNAKAKAALDAAITSYRTVINKAFPLKVDRSKAEVDTIRTNAESIKAQVAMKREYAAAKAKYDEAVAAKEAGDFEQAISLFAEAKTLFQEVYEKTKEKKEAAEAEIKSSQDGIKDAEERAKAGDEEMQGGGQ